MPESYRGPLRWLRASAAFLVALMGIWLAAAIVGLLQFPIGGGVYHAIFAYSDGDIATALDAYVGCVGTVAGAVAFLAWTGHRAGWGLLGAAGSLIGLQHWWGIYTYEPQSQVFHLVAGALMAAIPLLVFSAGWTAARFGPGRLTPGTWSTLRHLGLAGLGIPFVFLLLGSLGEKLFPSARSSSGMGIAEYIFLTTMILVPLVVAGGVHLLAAWLVLRRNPRLGRRIAFAATLPTLPGLLVLRYGWGFLQSFGATPVMAFAACGALAVYLLAASRHPRVGITAAA